MRRMIVIPVVLFLFVIQANNLLFASEDAAAKAKANTVAEEAKAKAGAVATEAETEASAVATEAKEEASSIAKDAKAEESTKTVVADTQSNVIATINGEEISRQDFDRRLNVFRRMNQDVTDVIKMQVVDQLTKKVLLKQFVDKKDINVSAEEIKSELEKIKFFLQNNPSNKDKPLEEILETQGSSLSELEEELSRSKEVFVSHYREKYVQPHTPPIWAIVERLNPGFSINKSTNSESVGHRVISTTGNPIFLAGYMIFTGFLSLYYYLLSCLKLNCCAIPDITY